MLFGSILTWRCFNSFQRGVWCHFRGTQRLCSCIVTRKDRRAATLLFIDHFSDGQWSAKVLHCSPLLSASMWWKNKESMNLKKQLHVKALGSRNMLSVALNTFDVIRYLNLTWWGDEVTIQHSWLVWTVWTCTLCNIWQVKKKDTCVRISTECFYRDSHQVHNYHTTNTLFDSCSCKESITLCYSVKHLVTNVFIKKNCL